jgi:hypothetical protein
MDYDIEHPVPNDDGSGSRDQGKLQSADGGAVILRGCAEIRSVAIPSLSFTTETQRTQRKKDRGTVSVLSVPLW